MKFSGAILLLLACQSDAFVVQPTGRAVTARPWLPTELLADLPADLSQQVGDAVTALPDALPDAAVAADAATDAASKASDNGWFGFMTGPIMICLQLLHSALTAVGVSANAWGVSIIAITVLIKVLTFPLTKTQLESTNKMQAMQPALKELQAKYQSNPEVMNQKIAEFYQANDINPLAGCLPSLAQIPIFIGLYRAVLDLAKADKLNEPFLWLPNLEGPTYGADPASGSAWLFQGWVDGVPSLGWDDTIAFLVLPVLLVASQFASMELMQPKNSEASNNVVLKLLPLMIGWFSLNVPAALCVYWFANNIITTSITVAIRNSMNTDDIVTPGAGGAATATPPPAPIFSPPREKPSGFGNVEPMAAVGSDGIKTLTKVSEDDIVDAVVEESPVEAEVAPDSDSSTPKKKRSPRKKKKKN